ncbi:MAG TPA: DUF3017 domain-containing protein [Streptosporangiaceae bacterium]|nr:DUF3017 domain-containing protein [Streptosporangiaceae bacterium]
MTHSAPSARSRRQRRAAASAASSTPAPAQTRPARDPGARRPAASGRGWWQHIPYAIVLCGLALALAWMRENGQNVRGGTLAVAGILFAAALARLALPERRAGMLMSRRRLADVAVLVALGAGLLVTGLMLQEH